MNPLSLSRTARRTAVATALVLGAASLLTAGPAHAAPAPPVATVVLDQVESYGPTWSAQAADGSVGPDAPAVAPDGVATLHFPEGTGLTSVTAKVGGQPVTPVIDQAARTVTVPVNPQHLDFGGQVWHASIELSGLTSVPDAETTLTTSVGIVAGAPSTTDLDASLYAGIITSPGTIARGVPFTVSLPTGPLFAGLPEVSFDGAIASVDDYFVGGMGDNISVDVPAVASANGTKLTLTVPRDLPPGHLNLSILLSVGAGPVAAASTFTELSEFDSATLLVSAIYQDVLGRAPESAGLASWVQLLHGGVSPLVVANAITGSTEFRSALIRQAYGDYLGREPSPAEVALWLPALASGTPQQLEQAFASSTEFAILAGGTDAGFVTALYETVLGRTPSSAEASAWVAALSSGAVSRGALPGAFVFSQEHLGAIVDAAYDGLLGRAAEASGRQSWIAYLATFGRLEGMLAGFVGGSEYRQLAGA